MTMFLLLIVGVGFALSYAYSNPLFLYVAFGVSLLTNIGAYWFSDTLVLSMANAKRIESKDDYPDFWNTTENLAITAGLPMPKLYIIDDPAPNAFATGRDKNHAVIAVTTMPDSNHSYHLTFLELPSALVINCHSDSLDWPAVVAG